MKETKMLFYKDAYLKKYQTKVVEIAGNKVLLKETIFFPQTSTEIGDAGKIQDKKVAGLKKEDGKIWHILNKPPAFEEKDVVLLQIDWKRRYKIMKLHSALHLWASVFDFQFKEKAIAGIVKLNSAYLVFKNELADEIIQKALDQANKDIQEGLEIKTYEDKKKKGFRWCQIGNYAPIPCGGIHIKNTKEIGKLILEKRTMEEEKQKFIINYV